MICLFFNSSVVCHSFVVRFVAFIAVTLKTVVCSLERSLAKNDIAFCTKIFPVIFPSK